MKPRRSILSVPGHMAKMHKKAVASTVDVVMLDLEDSVPLDAKIQARQQVVESAISLDWRKKVVTFRINSLETPFGYRDLLTIVEAAGRRVDSVVIPKVEHPGDVLFADRMLTGIELEYNIPHRIGIEASIETARGMENASAIAGASDRVCSLVFGIADYAASVDARLVSISGHGENEAEIYPGHRWHFPMSRIVMAAKARGISAIDAPYGNFKDDQGLMDSARAACALGFDGKWAIHPTQIDTINQVFSPAPEDVERARKVIAAFEAAKDKGRGAVAVEGRMVDQATVRLARQLMSKVTMS